jgi:TM2 domain-containing membrane protein YozV
MTFFFAAFCGAFAGNEFGSNIFITIFFGLIWGLLVYSIDQMMVQTIDKVYVDTISSSKKFWKYFFPRILLGCLLALFMSSPFITVQTLKK